MAEDWELTPEEWEWMYGSPCFIPPVEPQFGYRRRPIPEEWKHVPVALVNVWKEQQMICRRHSIRYNPEWRLDW
ncbi:hypothetical protein [Chroococcidiopsis sp. CCMEE 29]|uniref:hypothetical protein n=1 Tax=Chroococcidiopsis sp. CCMEE 29 TaxID=155894 RepID=UPI0020226C9E|nr:hypothetical protein [Chroococcidiopsis sp. CCMEE 29]